MDGVEDGRALEAFAGVDDGVFARSACVDEGADRRRHRADPLVEDLVVEEGSRAGEFLVQDGVDGPELRSLHRT